MYVDSIYQPPLNKKIAAMNNVIAAKNKMSLYSHFAYGNYPK